MECLQFGTDDPMTYFRLAHNLREKIPNAQSGVGERSEWGGRDEGDWSLLEGKAGRLLRCAEVERKKLPSLFTVNIRFNIAIIGNFE